MTNEQTKHRCEKCGAKLEPGTEKLRGGLCKTCALKLQYGVSDNRRRFVKRKK
jgi:predicted  nucleic acid-binding Zn-ribbon protein